MGDVMGERKRYKDFNTINEKRCLNLRVVLSGILYEETLMNILKQINCITSYCKKSFIKSTMHARKNWDNPALSYCYSSNSMFVAKKGSLVTLIPNLRSPASSPGDGI